MVSVSQPGKVGYDVSLEGMQKIGFYLEQDGEETKLSIGNPVLDGSSSKNLLYQKSSLATVKVDLDQVI
ncbi:TPA: hypothetical protein DEP21_06550 [Patescibacteria group bacterium]|nr:hypothetical protein [Candidatus Gracilibacteria bacterium]